MNGSTGRLWGAIATALALAVGTLAAVQSLGWFALDAAGAEPARMLFVDHWGPAATSGLIAIALLGAGLAGALTLWRTRPRPTA